MALIPKSDDLNKKTKPTVGKIDIAKLVSDVKKSFGKEQGLAAQITTGNLVHRPIKDEEFLCWKDSPWQQLTGVKGIPFGRVVQIAGRPDSGKSTHALKFMKCAQDQGILVIYWETEGKIGMPRFQEHFSGDPSTILMVTSKMILEGGDQVERYVHQAKAQDPDCKIIIVWDSVGGSLAKNEDEGSLVDGKQLAAASKENGQVIRAFVRLMERYKNREKNEENIAVLLINQVYANIGSVGQKESGGQKVEYFSSIIIQLTKKSELLKQIKGTKVKEGIITRAKVRKNHLFTGSYSVAELELEITAGDIRLADETTKSVWEQQTPDE